MVTISIKNIFHKIYITLKQSRMMIIFIIILIISEKLVKYGSIYSSGLIFLFIAFRVYRNRHFLKPILDQFETVVFGKPLNKELWKKGEKKNLRVYFKTNKGRVRLK